MRSKTSRRLGFTLVELLIVIAIIAVLIGILLPVLASARRAALDAHCKSNMRQICAAMLNYAAENRGRFPPNIDERSTLNFSIQRWCDVERIGRHLSGIRQALGAEVSNYRHHFIGGVMACPADSGGSASYAMNYFASSCAKIGTVIEAPNFPKAGKGWSANVKGGSKLILLTEQLSQFSDGCGGYMCYGVMPFWFTQAADAANDRFYPGMAFAGYPANHFSSTEWRYPSPETEFDWARHRQRGDGGIRYAEARGRANFGFADGHVESFRPDDLADRKFKRSKLIALWSPLDAYVDRLPRPNF